MSKQLLGQKAPDFSLTSSSGDVVKLSDYDGIWKVLFFYAKDGSPTCKRGCLNFKEQYELFLHKQHDYGPQNVAVGSLLKTKEDIKLSLLGLWFRIQDKTERIKTLLMRDDGNSVQDEPVVDSYNDISVYGIMAQVVSRGKWAK